MAPASTLPIRSKELSLRRIHNATAINPLLCAARSKRRCGSALAKVTVNVWSLQPYHLIRQAAVLTDPLADIRRVGAPQLLRVERGSGPVETKIRIGHHADVSARNVGSSALCLMMSRLIRRRRSLPTLEYPASNLRSLRDCQNHVRQSSHSDRELVPFGNSKYVHKIRQARLPRFYMDLQKLSSNDERRPSLKNDNS